MLEIDRARKNVSCLDDGKKRREGLKSEIHCTEYMQNFVFAMGFSDKKHAFEGHLGGSVS